MVASGDCEDDMRRVLMALMLGMAMAATAAAGDTDLAWLAGVPGLEGGVQTVKGDTVRIVYALKGDIDAVFAKIQQGLITRGWRIKKAADLSALGVETPSADIRSLRATKGLATLRLSLTGGEGSYSLSVKLAGGTTAPPGPARATAATPPAAPPVARTVKAAKRIELVENELVREIHCEGGEEVRVLGNECQLRLTGACGKLWLAGNENKVSIEGQIGLIDTPGNENRVLWSATANAQRPRISNLGRENLIRAE